MTGRGFLNRSIYILDRSWKDTWESLGVHLLGQAEVFVQASLRVPGLSNSSMSSYDVCMYVCMYVCLRHPYIHKGVVPWNIHTHAVSGGVCSAGASNIQARTHIHTRMRASDTQLCKLSDDIHADVPEAPYIHAYTHSHFWISNIHTYIHKYTCRV